MIINTLDGVFQDCVDAITTQTYYYRGARKDVLNWKDDPQNAEVMWLRPFMGKRSKTALGVPTLRMDVLLHFVINNYLTDREDSKVDIVDANYNAFVQWSNAFETHTIAPRDVEYDFIDIYDTQDANRSGLYVKVYFTFNTTAC